MNNNKCCGIINHECVKITLDLHVCTLVCVHVSMHIGDPYIKHTSVHTSPYATSAPMHTHSTHNISRDAIHKTTCLPSTVLKHRGGTSGVRLWVCYIKEVYSSHCIN